MAAVASAGGASEPEIILAGHLSKKGGMRWQRRWFELVRTHRGFSLRYFREQGDGQLRGELELDSMSTVASIGNKTGGFQVIVSGGRALKVAAEADGHLTAEVWKNALKDCIVDVSQTHTVEIHGQPFTVHTRYKPKRKMGAGAYGMVVSAVDEEVHPPVNVAIKKVKDAFGDLIDAKRILREIRLMRQFAHPNIIQLYDLITPPSLEDFEDVYIITELMSTDLQQIILARTPLNEDQQQWIMYQCLCGLNYMHSAGALHRDLKPANLLINTETCDVKICDFGLSRGELAQQQNQETPENAQQMTEYVVTRWYRAPEVMLGYHQYGSAVDVWSMGCIMGEMLMGKAVMPGKDYIDQLKLINKFIGSATEEDLWYVDNQNARNFMMNLPQLPPLDLHQKFPNASDEALDMMRCMLTMDPSKRYQVPTLLEHPYLQQVREQRLESDRGAPVDLEDVESLTINKANLQRMMFEEIRLFHEARSGAPAEDQGAAEMKS